MPVVVSRRPLVVVPILALLALVAALLLVFMPSPAHGAGVKNPVTGTIDPRQQATAAQAAAGTDSWVVDVTWATLQPDSSSQTLRAGAAGDGGTADIAAAISTARSYNATHPDKRVRLKIRVNAGVDSPTWAKNTGGAKLTVTNTTPSSTTTDTVGRWWTSAYATAYGHLLSLLGAKYDATAQIGDFVTCESGVFFCDGTKQMGDGSNSQTYLNAGYTQAADIAAQKTAIVSAAAAFPTTRVEQAQFHFQYVATTNTQQDSSNCTGTTCTQVTCRAGSVCQSFAANFAVMDYAITKLGPGRAIESSYNLNPSRTTDASYFPIYNRLAQDAKAAKATVGYQTGRIDSATDELCRALQYAADTTHANFVETTVISANGCPLTGADSVQTWDRHLEANPYPAG